MRLADASILVTGASSGIGAALARRLAAAGARLTLTARRGERLERLARDLVREVPGLPAPRVVVADVADPASAPRILDGAFDAWGSLDALVNNAGTSVYGDASLVATTELRRVLEINFHAPVRLTLAAVECFRDQGRGTVLNVASLAALHGVPFLGAYGASKAALANFSQALRAELRGTGIRVGVVYPGYTDTELFLREATTGTARRPDTPYASPDRVAAAIAAALRNDRDEVVLTTAGHAMRVAGGVAPSLLDRFMARIAARLRTPGAGPRQEVAS